MNEIEKRALELLCGECDMQPEDFYGEMPVSGDEALRAIAAALSAAPQVLPASLEQAARDALPFVAYAYSKGVSGAEEAGRAIEKALGGMPEQQA